MSSRVFNEDFVGAAATAEAVIEHYSPGYVTTIDAR